MTNEPAQPEAHMPARAAGGPGLQPVELMISTNSRRISELEARLSASMCVSDEIIQDFQRRLSALQAEPQESPPSWTRCTTAAPPVEAGPCALFSG